MQKYMTRVERGSLTLRVLSDAPVLHYDTCTTVQTWHECILRWWCIFPVRGNSPPFVTVRGNPPAFVTVRGNPPPLSRFGVIHLHCHGSG